MRLFAAAPAAADAPAPQLPAAPLLPWQPASAQAVGGKNFTAFSAACWTMGREIYDALGGAVPVGLVQATFGGAPFSAAFPLAWYPNVTSVCGAPPAPAAGAPAFGAVANAMIYPFFPEPPIGQPTAFKGTVWAFGESSVPPRGTDADVDWFRCAWMLDASPVNTANIWPQLGPLSAPMWTDAVARLRDAQRDGTVGTERWEAVIGTADLGDVASPFTAPYFRNQSAVGKRFAAAMLNLAYGHSTPAYLGPRASAAAVSAASNESAAVAITVAFEPASVASGLVHSPAACPAGLPQDDPNDGWGASSCVGWRVLSGRAAFPPAPAYAPQIPGGFIGAGDDLPGSGLLTVAQAEAACTADLACVGFTFNSDSVDCGGAACNVYLKSAYSFTPAAGWQTYNSSRAPVGRWYNAGNVSVSADGKTVVVLATLPNAGDSVAKIAYGYAPWPLHSLANGAGLPALPFIMDVAQPQPQPQPQPRGRRLQLQPWLALQPRAYAPLPLGAVMPAGWLAAQIAVSADGLPGWLHRFYGPVMNSPWITNCTPTPCEDTNEGCVREARRRRARGSMLARARCRHPVLLAPCAYARAQRRLCLLVCVCGAAGAPLAQRAPARRRGRLCRPHPRQPGGQRLAGPGQRRHRRQRRVGALARARGLAALARGHGRRAHPAGRARAPRRELPPAVVGGPAGRQLGGLALARLCVHHRVGT
jgi:hypothetical protein